VDDVFPTQVPLGIVEDEEDGIQTSEDASELCDISLSHPPQQELLSVTATVQEEGSLRLIDLPSPAKEVGLVSARGINQFIGIIEPTSA